MASIHEQPGKPNYFAAYYDPEGFRRFRSTGTDNAKIARIICAALERASILARKGRLSNEKALKLIRETCNTIGETHSVIQANAAHLVLKTNVEDMLRAVGGELVSYSIRTWLDSWLESRTDASKATLLDYRRILDLFYAFLGTRSDRPLTTLQAAQVEEFKKHLGGRVAPSTVNKAVKVLKAGLGNAVAKRQLEFNPAAHVAPIEAEQSQRRPFTPEELGKLIRTADLEWKTMVLIGYYTGLRLNDCADLTWEAVDLLNGTIELSTQKTGRAMVIPIADPLAKHLNTIAGDKPDAPLCPGMHGKSSSLLSNQFYQVMFNAGLVPKRDHQGKGVGRDGRREMNRISFHSLRYNCTSALKSAGVSESVAMDIVGHETAAVSRNYTKIDFETKRAALAKLPNIV